MGKNLNEVPGWEKLDVLKDFAHALNHVKEHKPQDELIFIFDDNGFGELADYLESQGFKVIGGGRIDDRLENDRDFAAQFMGKFMKVPETATFESFQEGLGFLKAQEKDARFVFKPNDADVPKEYTYVAKDVPDMVSFINDVRAKWNWKESFQLQTFIQGTEVDFSAYFNGTDWMQDSLMIYFENKPIGNDNIGPATGGSIAVEIGRPLKGTFFDILNKITPHLKKIHYVGQWSVNCIVSEDDKKPYFLEMSPRFGYPSFALDITLIEDNGKEVYQFFKAMTQGKNTSFFSTDKVAVTIGVYKFPFPHVKGHDDLKGLPMSWDKKWDRYFFPYYIMGEKGKMVLSGDEAEILQVTCADATLDGAVSMLYDIYMPTLKLQSPFWRTDLGKDAKKRMSQLKKWGLL